MLHDTFLQNLGNYQSAFVNSRLDEFFATGNQHVPIKNLDLDDLIQQLNNRSRDVPKSKNVTTASTIQSTPSKDIKDASDSDKSSRGRTACEYCGIRWHGEKNCRSKRPETAPINWLKENIDRVNAARKKNGDEPYKVPDSDSSKPAAKMAVNATAVDTTSTYWGYDTCVLMSSMISAYLRHIYRFTIRRR
jgi:hypothetical protein